MTTSLKQFTKNEDSEPKKDGYGPAKRVFNGSGPMPTLPKGVTNLYENFLHGLQISKDKNLFGHRQITNGVAGPYVFESYESVGKRILNLAAGFIKLGIKPNSNVALFSINRSEWVIAEQACFVQGMVTVPLYDTLGNEAIEYILNLTETPLVVCTQDKVKKLLSLCEKIPQIKVIISMDGVTQELLNAANASKVQLLHFAEVEKNGANSPVAPVKITSETIATLCFTSGTTGLPKGVMLSHGNILSFPCGAEVLASSGHMKKFNENDVHLSYLPLAHIFERIVMATIIYYGGSIGFYQGDVLKLTDDAAALKPTIFASVPRLYNKIYDKVMAGVKQKGGIAEKLFNTGFQTKKQNLSKGIVTHWFWDAIVFKKIAARLGGKVQIMLSGAAPISPEVLDFLKIGFSCNVAEGYGQTENSAAASSHILIDPTVGHIGVPNPTCLIRLRDVPEMNYTSNDKPFPRGEICVKGAGVFKGYYKSPEKTKETLSEDGWLHSGDIGEWDEQGRLKIIDRVKNIFKLAQGEYIAPEKIEIVYTKHSAIAQAFIHGDSLQSTLVAIVVPDPDAFLPWAQSKGFSGTLEQLAKNAQVIKTLTDELEKFGRANDLKGFETAKSIYIEPVPFSAENDLLTPTFKLKVIKY
jgi:long-chain acyl-CoA synthetase